MRGLGTRARGFGARVRGFGLRVLGFRARVRGFKLGDRVPMNRNHELPVCPVLIDLSPNSFQL